MTYDERRELEARRRELAERVEREDAEQEISDIASVLSTEAGRRLFAAVIGRGKVFGKVFDASEGDPARLAYETGRREYAVDLYRKANAVANELVYRAIAERNAISAKRRRMFEELENGKENT